MAVKTYEMFSIEGDLAVDKWLYALKIDCALGRVQRRDLAERVRRDVQAIAQQHPEVTDTAVRECVMDVLDKICADNCWQPLEDVI